MNKTKIAITLIALLGGLSLSDVEANVRHYSVPVEQSQWQMSKQTRLVCELEHSIPGFGSATFVSEASRQLNLQFNLDMLRLPSRYDTASVYSMPPSWMRGAQQRTLGEMTLRKQYDADLPEDIAWDMLTELEKGYWPTIYYKDWANKVDSVAVALNASNFMPEYDAFSYCINNLLPYSFDDISYTVLTYKDDSAELSRFSKSRLDMIGEYLKEDIDLELVLIDSYTDSYGAEWLNEQLAMKRAQNIKEYFTSLGIDDGRIETTAHGERRHTSPNDSANERMKNRRVVIRMNKS